jgi:hypothetical protein
MAATSSLTQPSSLLSSSQQRIENLFTLDPPAPTLPISWSLVSSISILGAIAFSLAACLGKELQPSVKVKPADDQLSCHSCKYYHSNLYVNCALHPTTVLSDAAINCEDYSPNSQIKRAEELQKKWSIVRLISRCQES